MIALSETTIDNRSIIESSGGVANLGEVLYTLAVNFLLYVVLIIVFYMLVRFYLDDESAGIERQPKYVVENASENIELEEDAENVQLITSSDINLSKEDKPDSFLSTLGRATSHIPDIGTKQEVTQRAIFCTIGLNITFCIWGVLQERMLTYPYDGEYFKNSFGLVFFTRLGGLALSAFLMYQLEIKWVSSPLHEYSFPAVANMLSSWCQYEALKYISFPTQVLAKAFKLVPVMLMGRFLHDKTYESYEYSTAATIGFGIYIFLDSSEHLELGRDVWSNPYGAKGALCGVVLLLLFLFFDSFTGQWQARMFKINQDISMIQMMLLINAFSAVFSFITLVHGQELYGTLLFVYSHPTFMVHLSIYCLCAIIGQLFIFYTVKNFGAVVFSIIMSIRLLFSIMLSCFIYSHPVSELGLLGIIVVFAAITYRVKRKTEDSPLFHWKDSAETHKKIFSAWHEHVDI